MRGAQNYFREKIEGELGGLVEAFKAARLFCPQKVIEMQPTANSVDSLKAFQFLDKQEGWLEGGVTTVSCQGI